MFPLRTLALVVSAVGPDYHRPDAPLPERYQAQSAVQRRSASRYRPGPRRAGCCNISGQASRAYQSVETPLGQILSATPDYNRYTCRPVAPQA